MAGEHVWLNSYYDKVSRQYKLFTAKIASELKIYRRNGGAMSN